MRKKVEAVLDDAFEIAKSKRHEFLTIEHLLLAITHDDDVANTLLACKVDLQKLQDDLSEYVDTTIPLVPKSHTQNEPKTSLGYERVIKHASVDKTEVTGVDILISIFNESKSEAVNFLKKQEVAQFDIINLTFHQPTIVEGYPRHHSPEQALITQKKLYQTDDDNDEEPLIEKYATNLNEEVRQGRIDPLVGRKYEVKRISQILSRRRKNNPLLVGSSGVGKTSIAEGIAYLIEEGNISDSLTNSTVYSLDLGSMIAGTKYRGDFEKRFKGLLAEIKEDNQAILFIDEIHIIIGAGATAGTMDASNLLKPFLNSGNVRCIGSTTFEEYRRIFEKDGALSRRFQKIDVNEPSVEETYQILKGLKSKFEEHYNLRFSNSALRSASELACRYINNRLLPDKAIDVIDEAGAHQNLLPPHERKKIIDTEDVELVIADIARIPSKNISSSDKMQLSKLEEDINKVVFGQSEAISALTTAIKLSRAGLKSIEKPIGSFLFAGPTGVGKTEVCRQLAKVINLELIRFDMSEYMEAHTVSRLIGTPPGYVGYDQGGLLTDAVVQTPNCVLLLDEIEKAHPDVFNLLLQIMDHGMLTDSNGRKADYRNVILVMTTNAGAEAITKKSIGFTTQNNNSDGMIALQRLFTPEFRNRLDSIIQFSPLSITVILSVVDKFLLELETQLNDKNVTVCIDTKTREYIAEHSYDQLMGARPIARFIQENIKKPLAEMVLFGALAENGGKVNIVVINNKIKLVAEPPKNLQQPNSKCSSKI